MTKKHNLARILWAIDNFWDTIVNKFYDECPNNNWEIAYSAWANVLRPDDREFFDRTIRSTHLETALRRVVRMTDSE